MGSARDSTSSRNGSLDGRTMHVTFKEDTSMKRVLTGTCLAAAFAVGLAAQTPQNPPQNPPAGQPPMQEAKDAAKNVTVTGCLKAGDTADSFILSDLKWDKGK